MFVANVLALVFLLKFIRRTHLFALSFKQNYFAKRGKKTQILNI